jgi:hypothetical protein
MLLVNTLSEGCRKFSLFYKNALKASAKMSIEKRENMCYNEITKKEEVQSDENLNPKLFKRFSDICIEHNERPNFH